MPDPAPQTITDQGQIDSEAVRDIKFQPVAQPGPITVYSAPRPIPSKTQSETGRLATVTLLRPTGGPYRGHGLREHRFVLGRSEIHHHDRRSRHPRRLDLPDLQCQSDPFDLYDLDHLQRQSSGRRLSHQDCLVRHQPSQQPAPGSGEHGGVAHPPRGKRSRIEKIGRLVVGAGRQLDRREHRLLVQHSRCQQIRRTALFHAKFRLLGLNSDPAGLTVCGIDRSARHRGEPGFLHDGSALKSRKPL